MSLKKFVSGAWQDVEVLKRFAGGAWQECESAKRFNGSAWQNVWENYGGTFAKSGSFPSTSHLKVLAWDIDSILFEFYPYDASTTTIYFQVTLPTPGAINVEFEWSVISDLAFNAASPIYMCDKIKPAYKLDSGSVRSFSFTPEWPTATTANAQGTASGSGSATTFTLAIQLSSLTVSLMSGSENVRLLVDKFKINGRKYKFPQSLTQGY